MICHLLSPLIPILQFKKRGNTVLLFITVSYNAKWLNLSICLSLNFIVFPKIYDITSALLKSEIDGAFVDSFIITAHLNLIRDHPGIRIERTIEHPVTYGMVLAGNSSRMESCARRYVENYPRKVFQKIAEHLKPLKVGFYLIRNLSLHGEL